MNNEPILDFDLGVPQPKSKGSFVPINLGEAFVNFDLAAAELRIAASMGPQRLMQYRIPTIE